MKTIYVPVDDIIVLKSVERKVDLVEDDGLRVSVKADGIQVPLVAVVHEAKTYLIDGLTRLRVARALNLESVPIAPDSLPEGRELDRYVRDMRFILNYHRQDLLPSQLAELVDFFKRPPFEMTHREIARHLRVKPDTVTSALSVKFYIEPVVKAVDSGRLTRHAARVFDGLTDKGQQAIWKAHKKQLQREPGGIIHAKLRARYSPQTHADYYKQPELIAQRLNRKGQQRKGHKRPNIDTQEKLRLISTVDWQEGELRTFAAESKRLDQRRDATIIPAPQILRNETLSEMLSPDMKAELEAWSSIYC